MSISSTTADVKRKCMITTSDHDTSISALITEMQPALARLFDGKEHLVARDKSQRMHPYEPEIHVETIKTKTPEDHLPGAKSVIVVGLRLPKASVRRTALEPAEAVGPYAFAQYDSINLLALWGFRAMRWLEDRGYRAMMTFDLTGTGSVVGNPRGEQPDAFCNRFAAVAAGLGRIGKGGFVLTPEFGPNVRFAAIVTDADMPRMICLRTRRFFPVARVVRAAWTPAAPALSRTR